MTPATVSQILAVATPQICREESCRLTAYLDSRGIWTIGWGRADSGVTRGITCTQAQADLWRDQKLRAICDDLEFHLPWWRNYGAARAAVLLEMAYQLGVGGLLGFRNMLDAVRAEDWVSAAKDAGLSAWAKQTPGREAREATQLRTGAAA
jgi:lysozyme